MQKTTWDCKNANSQNILRVILVQIHKDGKNFKIDTRKAILKVQDKWIK